MIFRDYNGKLVEINRLDFKNDKSYYNKIIQTKNPKLFNELFNELYINNVNNINNTKNNRSNYSTYLISKIIN